MLEIERVERLHLVLLIAVVAGAVLTRWVDPASVAAGGALMGANVWTMKRALRRALRPGGRAWTALAVALMVGKFGFLLLAVGLLFWYVSLDGLSFALGITLFLIAAVVEAVRAGTPQ